MLVNTFSMLSPTGWSVQTPPEFQPWGWTSLDFLVAPTITALFATLTHSQGAWRDAHIQAYSYMEYGALNWNLTASTHSASKAAEGGVEGGVPFDDESARAICALILMGLFSGRAVKNFGGLAGLSKMVGIGEFRSALPLVCDLSCLTDFVLSQVQYRRSSRHSRRRCNRISQRHDILGTNRHDHTRISGMLSMLSPVGMPHTEEPFGQGACI